MKSGYKKSPRRGALVGPRHWRIPLYRDPDSMQIIRELRQGELCLVLSRKARNFPNDTYRVVVGGEFGWVQHYDVRVYQ